MSALTSRVLDLTLLLRQGLLAREDVGPVALAERLMGLQAQEGVSPYLSVAARTIDADPHVLSHSLADRRLVRVVTMRGTVHVHTPADAGTLRTWAQPAIARATTGEAREVLAAVGDGLAHDVAEILAEGPVAATALGERLATIHLDHSPGALVQAARIAVPLVQVPPRGLWRRPGGVVYAHLEQWTGQTTEEPDVPALVRRYLAAYGPATAADMTTWSGVTGLGPVLAAMLREGALTSYAAAADDRGRRLLDLPGAPIADESTDAPPRLLGRYDDLWLSHARRDRVLSPEDRHRWMAANGAAGCLLLVDGRAAGLWSGDTRDAREVSLELWRPLPRSRRAALEAEVERVRALLRVAPDEVGP